MDTNHSKVPYYTSPLWHWLLVFVILTAVGLLNFSIIHTDALATNRSNYDWREYFIYEFTGSYTAFFLVMPLVYIWKRFPVYTNWSQRLPIYIVITIGVGVIHTTLMLLSRTLLFPLILDREFHYGNLWYRYLMEFHKQVVWVWLTFGVVTGIQQIYRHQQNKLKEAKLQTQLAHSRLEQVRQQINPHFLFNSLNLISSKVYEDAESADQLISDLSDLLRQSLDMSKTPTTSLKTELGFVNNYLSIMQSRFSDRVSIERQLDADCLDYEVPSLLLQPIVENSFKHRLEARNGSILISLSCRKIGSELEIMISDTFTPTSTQTEPENTLAKPSTGTGLSNIRERIEYLYSGKATFEYGPKDEFHYQTCIRIPLKPQRSSHD